VNMVALQSEEHSVCSTSTDHHIFLCMVELVFLFGKDRSKWTSDSDYQEQHALMTKT